MEDLNLEVSCTVMMLKSMKVKTVAAGCIVMPTGSRIVSTDLIAVRSA